MFKLELIKCKKKKKNVKAEEKVSFLSVSM